MIARRNGVKRARASDVATLAERYHEVFPQIRREEPSRLVAQHNQPRQIQPRQIIEGSLVGSLGTLNENGFPFVTLVTVAATSPTSIVMLLSGLAQHTKNLDRVPNCSLLLVQAGGEQGDPLAGARLTITGLAARIPRNQSGEARTRFLEAHPSAAMYADFADFSFFQLDIHQVHLVAGFGHIETIPASKI